MLNVFITTPTSSFWMVMYQLLPQVTQYIIL